MDSYFRMSTNNSIILFLICNFTWTFISKITEKYPGVSPYPLREAANSCRIFALRSSGAAAPFVNEGGINIYLAGWALQN